MRRDRSDIVVYLQFFIFLVVLYVIFYTVITAIAAKVRDARKTDFDDCVSSCRMLYAVPSSVSFGDNHIESY